MQFIVNEESTTHWTNCHAEARTIPNTFISDLLVISSSLNHLIDLLYP